MSKSPRLSVQLYSLRAMPDLEDQLALVRRAGLDFVETTSTNYDVAATMRDATARLGLAIPSGHLGIDRLRSEFDATVAILQSFGIRTAIVWGLPEAEHPKSPEDWIRAGAELGQFAQRLAEHDLAFAFHNHDWELDHYRDGQIGLDLLFAGAGDHPLRWQADLAWLARGGADIDALLNRHGDRLVSVHLKDLALPGTATTEDGWADLGEGILPWAEWIPRLRRLGVDHFVLEHDEPSDPVRFLTRSAAAARSLLHISGSGARP